MSIKSIGTHIKVKDFGKSVKFYETLGFEKVFHYGPDQEVKEDYNGIVFEHGGCKLEIADGHRAVNAATFAETVNSSKISLMIQVESLSEIISRCEAADIPIAVGPRHYYWGTLELVVKDPDGVVLVFVAAFDESEAMKVSAEVIKKQS